MSSDLFKDVEDLKPVITPGNSDSAALDNVFELLVHSGKPVPLIKLMMMPDAWSKRSKILPKAHQQLFDVLNSTIEPWDGPAAICATDSKWAIAATDRNGLRPLRYSITSDNILCAGSETGMVQIPESKIISKGISAGNADNMYRGLVEIKNKAINSRNYTQCDSLLMGNKCGAHTIPYIKNNNATSTIEHEATTTKINEEQLYYCNQRGLDQEEAVSLIVNGFCKEVLQQLPMEFAVEAQKLVAISLEGSVG